MVTDGNGTEVVAYCFLSETLASSSACFASNLAYEIERAIEYIGEARMGYETYNISFSGLELYILKKDAS
jgi:hypothetical protein